MTGRDCEKCEHMAIQALEQEPRTKNDSKFCPDRKAKTTHMETILHCIEDECAAYKDGRCLKYNSNQEPTTKNDLGVDCISRQALYDALYERFHEEDTNNITNVTLGSVRNFVKDFPSVTPQEPKTGHWIKSNIPNEKYVCSECGSACWYYDYQASVSKSKYCPNCGSYNGGDSNGNE